MLASLLVVMAVVGVISTSIFAATANAAGAQDTQTVLGGAWDLVSTNCGKEHEHTADCYSDHKICDHKDGHLPSCYLPISTFLSKGTIVSIPSHKNALTVV